MNIKKLYVVPFLSLMCLSLGSLGPNATATIGTWEITDSYGSNTFSVSCSFTASSFEPSSATDSHTL